MPEKEPHAGSPPVTRPAATVQVRPVEVGDVDFVVTQHLTHFPDGFFARLGDEFLREYYRSFIACAGAVALFAVRGTEPVGFLTGALDPAEHRRQMLKRDGRRLALRAATAMLVRPALAIFFLRTRAVRYLRRLLGRAPAPPPAEPAGRTGVLHHVVVTPAVQAQGIGSKLVAHFEAMAADAGLSSITLVTAAGPQGAGEFYVKEGWTRVGEHRMSDGLILTTFTKHVAGHDGTERTPQLPS
jgi:GNAT superfamily N-acetyltransferase